MSSDVSSPAGMRTVVDSADTSPEAKLTASLKPEKRQKFPCELCPYVANTVESLKKHVGYHEPNSDSKFVCKRCPYYCTSKIELGIHSMVHAMQKKPASTEDEGDMPQKKARLDQEIPEAKPTTPRSRMSPFKRSPSFCPSQKHTKKKEEELKLSTPKSKLELNMRTPESLNKSSSFKPSSSSLKKKRVPLYKCTLCPYSSHWQTNLDDHNRRHIPGEDRPFECEECPYYAPNNIALANHRRVHEANPGNTSLEMDDIDNNEEYYEDEDDEEDKQDNADAEIEVREKKYKKRSIQAVCALCPQTFTFKGNIYRHMKLHTASADRPFKCKYCSFQVSTSWNLDAHLRLHTGAAEVVEKSEEVITEDESVHEEPEDTIEESIVSEKKYSCESEDTMAEDAINEKKYSCNRCPYATDYRRLMKVHIEQHEPSDERQACCDYCPYYVTTRKALCKHMIVHEEYRLMKEGSTDRLEDREGNEEPPRKCKLCPYTTTSGHSLKRHVEFHSPSEERQVQCPYCPYFVKSQARLSTHITVHPEHVQNPITEEVTDEANVGEEKPRKRQDHFLICAQCPYTTRFPDNMDIHRSHHTPSETRPHKCSHCPFFAKHPSSIATHAQLHVNETNTSNDQGTVERRKSWVEKYKCTICPYRACDPKYFRRHLELHEPDADRPLKCPDCPFYVKTKSGLWRHSLLHEAENAIPSQVDDDDEDPDVIFKETNESTDNFMEEGEGSSGKDKETRKVFTCQICPYRTFHTSEFQKHKENHVPSESRQAKCKYCPYYLATFHGLSKHLHLHPEHKNPDYASNKEFSPIKESSFADVCEDNTILKTEASENGSDVVLMNTKNDVPNNSPSLSPASVKNIRGGRQCPLCPYVANPAKMKIHQLMHIPSEDRQSKCPHCPFYVKSNNSLGGHTSLHSHRRMISDVESKDGDTVDEKHETDDEAIASGEGEEYEGRPQSSRGTKPRRFKCSHCPYIGRKSDVEVHMVAHVPNEKYIHNCEFCTYSALNKGSISSHSKVHNPEYLMEMMDIYHILNMDTDEQDEEQGEREQNAVELDSGVKCERWTVDKPRKIKKYKCIYCPYYGQRKEIETHILGHKPNGKNNVKCRFCSYGSTTRGAINSHQKVHTPEYLMNVDVLNIEPYVVVNAEDDDEDRHVAMEDSIELAKKESDESDSEPSVQNENKMAKTGKANRNRKVQCSFCPYLARKDVMEIHLQAHKPNSKNTHKCEVCSFSGANKFAISCHMRVHQPDYVSNMASMYEVQLDSNQFPDFSPPSPAKSDISDVSDCDVIEMANIKQQLITAKIVSVPYDTDGFQFGAEELGKDEIKSVYVNKEGDMRPGLLKKMYKCKFCPLKHIQRDKIKIHQKMHKEPGKYNCLYCTYRASHKTQRNRHMKVHAMQYDPGVQEVNDYECLPEEETEESEVESKEEEEEDMEVSFKVTEDKSDSSNSDKAKVSAAVKSPDGNSIRINSKPALAMSNMPTGVEYYVRQDSTTGQNYLERASVGKWCCEKCPYATMDKDRFENHAVLHASHQRYVCEYCDYSVPVYSFLLVHRKLHLHPNTNLLAMQSITNLLSLPEIPADVAAAANFPGHSPDPISQFGTHDHIELFENSDQYSEPRKLYRCDRCPYTNVRRDNLLAHLKFHMMSSDLKCDYCDYSVSKHELLVQHIKVHFVDPSSIKMDMNSNPIRSATSDGTKRVLNDAANVKPSRVNRNKIKTSSSGASRQTPEDQDLNNNGSNWICQYCDRAFNASDRLLRHEMQHLIGQPVS